jgi:hypothetical protein
MFSLIAEAESAGRQHRKKLQSLMDQAGSILRIASPYVTDSQLLSDIKDREVRLLTHTSRMDFVVGASSLESLTALIKAGVQCRYTSKRPRLHAKVYLFDNQSAVITSANLTRRALDENLEVGVHLSGPSVTQLAEWFDTLWEKADKLDLEILARWSRDTEVERAEYSNLRKKLEKQPPLSSGPATKMLKLYETANQFFVCNTNRRHSREVENHMRDRGYAAAWEPFHFPSHMQRVKKGHAIFMYAKGHGIIGIGLAKDSCQILEPGSSDRIALGKTREWRVPVDWLIWKDDSDACPGHSRNSTFFDVSEEKYAGLLENIKKHFLSPS